MHSGVPMQLFLPFHFIDRCCWCDSTLLFICSIPFATTILHLFIRYHWNSVTTICSVPILPRSPLPSCHLHDTFWFRYHCPICSFVHFDTWYTMPFCHLLILCWYIDWGNTGAVVDHFAPLHTTPTTTCSPFILPKFHWFSRSFYLVTICLFPDCSPGILLLKVRYCSGLQFGDAIPFWWVHCSTIVSFTSTFILHSIWYLFLTFDAIFDTIHSTTTFLVISGVLLLIPLLFWFHSCCWYIPLFILFIRYDDVLILPFCSFRYCSFCLHSCSFYGIPSHLLFLIRRDHSDYHYIYSIRWLFVILIPVTIRYQWWCSFLTWACDIYIWWHSPFRSFCHCYSLGLLRYGHCSIVKITTIHSTTCHYMEKLFVQTLEQRGTSKIFIPHSLLTKATIRPVMLIRT